MAAGSGDPEGWRSLASASRCLCFSLVRHEPATQTFCFMSYTQTWTYSNFGLQSLDEKKEAQKNPPKKTIKTDYFFIEMGGRVFILRFIGIQ